MKVLIVGGGGREHAIALKIKENPEVTALYAAPGNGGIAQIATCLPFKATDVDGIVRWAAENKVDFVIVAPDDPLCLGMVDALAEQGIPAFGPRKNAAIIEGSKVFSKNLMKKYGIPTAAYETFDDYDAAVKYLQTADMPIVVKADGLALGKGVLICENEEQAAEGVKELIVVAQDPTAYGEDWGKPGSICELLDKLNKIQGLEWIRIMYAYPERITDDFIAAMKRNNKVVPYLDLPIQHCNDTILKNMNRRSNRAELLDVIGKLRREIPGITLRTTLIAGFPGETEEQFEDLCNFVKEVQFDRLGCFAYSAEENTVAAKMDGQIEQEVKDKRAEIIMQIQTGIMAQKQADKVGQTVRVLCDGIDEESGLYLCRTMGDAPEVDGNVCVSSEEPLYPGQFYDVLVDDSDLYDLYGTVAK